MAHESHTIPGVYHGTRLPRAQHGRHSADHTTELREMYTLTHLCYFTPAMKEDAL